MSNYQDQWRECDSCAAKPGSPILCSGCLHNRDLIAKHQAHLAEVKKEIEGRKGHIRDNEDFNVGFNSGLDFVLNILDSKVGE